MNKNEIMNEFQQTLNTINFTIRSIQTFSKLDSWIMKVDYEFLINTRDDLIQSIIKLKKELK